RATPRRDGDDDEVVADGGGVPMLLTPIRLGPPPRSGARHAGKVSAATPAVRGRAEWKTREALCPCPRPPRRTEQSSPALPRGSAWPWPPNSPGVGTR